jgi:DNA-directed RNA polymerase subunit K
MAKNQVEKPEVVYTKYEKARMIGSRSLQIAMGAPFLLKLSKKELEKVKYNPIEIAMQEFSAGVLPITVRRPNALV